MYRLLHNRDPLSADKVFATWKTYRVRTTQGEFYVSSPCKMGEVLKDIEDAQIVAKKQNFRYRYYEVLGIDETSNEQIGTVAHVDI